MAAAAGGWEDKYSLITENLEEILNGEIIEQILKKGETPKIYWGTATTGKPHCGYFVPIIKIAQFLQAGCHVKILLADVHGFLDNLKAPIELVESRAKYYKHCITALLKAVQVPIEKLEFVLGSSYQLSSKYTMDLYRLTTLVTERDAKRAGSEVVKQVDNATLSGLIYPLLQTLDEEYLGVDVQFGGVDQRKIFTLAMETLPRIGYKSRAHLMNPMVPGLAGGKMSASDANSKIDLLDSADVVGKKIKKAVAVPKELEGNGLVSFIEFVLFPASQLLSGKRSFVVEWDGKETEYKSVQQLRDAYTSDALTPQMIKPALTAALQKLLDPIREAFAASAEWQEIEKAAYPPPPPPEKKQKVKKDKGSFYPGGGAKKVAAAPGGEQQTNDDAAQVGEGASEAIQKLAVDDKS